MKEVLFDYNLEATESSKVLSRNGKVRFVFRSTCVVPGLDEETFSLYSFKPCQQKSPLAPTGKAVLAHSMETRQITICRAMTEPEFPCYSGFPWGSE